tara:strand:- start:280 stop:837 length:558 start_codon:yes stop_codon:yes gene_type:complete
MEAVEQMDQTYYPEEFEEYYHNEGPALSDSDEEESISVKSESTVSSDKKKQRKLMDKYKQQTKGYVILNPKEKKRRYRIEAYYTISTPGAPIRNAVTGYFETDYLGKIKFSVGSVWEDLFFKVADSTSTTSYTFFYDSPEQCERHRNIQLNRDDVKKWYMKHEHVKKILRIEEDRIHAQQSVQIK